MAETVTWDVLRELAEFRAEKGCAISLYVNLDPSVSPTADDADTRISSLIDEAERSQGANSSHLTHEQRVGLKADFERITDYFENQFSRDGTQGVAIFLAGLDNAWRALSLSDPVPDKARVSGEFYLAPLVPLDRARRRCDRRGRRSRARSAVPAAERPARGDRRPDRGDPGPARPGRLVAGAFPAAHREARGGAPP